HADRRAGDRPDIAAYLARILGRFAAELAAPGIVGDLTTIGLAVDEDVDVPQPVGGIDGNQKRDRLILALDLAHDGKSQQRVAARDPVRRIRVDGDLRRARAGAEDAPHRRRHLRWRLYDALRHNQRDQWR